MKHRRCRRFTLTAVIFFRNCSFSLSRILQFGLVSLKGRCDLVPAFCTSCDAPSVIHSPFIYARGATTSGSPPRCPIAHGSSPSTCQTHFCDGKSLYSFFSSSAQIYFPFFSPSFIKGKPELHGKRTHTSRAVRSPGPVILHLHFSHLADALIQSDLQRVQRQTEPECSDVGENMRAEEKRSGFLCIYYIWGCGFGDLLIPEIF